MTSLLAYLELDESSFLKRLNGTFKYGIQFENWSELGNQYMHAFGDIGTPLGTLSFTQAWLKCAAALNFTELGSYIPSAVAAKTGKFHPPVDIPQGANPTHFYPLSLLFYTIASH